MKKKKMMKIWICNFAFSLGSMLNYNQISVLQYIIMQVIAIKSMHIILELMNLLYGNKFSPWEDFFVNPFRSDVISPNQLCECTCMYIGRGAGRSTCSGTMKLNRFCSWEV